MRWLLFPWKSIPVYCTIPFYTIQNISRDHGNIKLDRIFWFTTFWPPMSANSKMGRYTSVALLVFKWAAKIFIVYLGQIYSDQWTNSYYTDILFEGVGVYRLISYFLSNLPKIVENKIEMLKSINISHLVPQKHHFYLKLNCKGTLFYLILKGSSWVCLSVPLSVCLCVSHKFSKLL